MGLLGQIIGGLAGNALGSGAGRGPLGGMGSLGGLGALGGGKTRLMMALLPLVLNMLSSRQRGNQPGAGLGVVGGAGGLGGLLQEFSRKGYASQADSWVATGPNQPLPPEALQEVLGGEQITQIARQAGISEDEARSGLSELIPETVDHFTPEGRLPADNDLASSVDDYLRRLGSQG